MATLAHESQGVQTIPPPPTEDTPCSPIVISPLERHADMTDGEAMTDLTMDAINDTVSGASTSDRPKPIRLVITNINIIRIRFNFWL